MTDHAQTTDEIRASFAAGYDLERELLGGGMSRVFLATERALNRKVVIKVLPPELAAGVNRERFRREVQLAAQLQHPHIVPLYAAGAQGDVLYYTMPFIEGESLKHAIQEKKRFSPREVLRVLHDVVDALGYAHERGVIHRDIKPGNVLRSGSHAVVTDFGVAKAISAAMPAVGMTTSGMAIGTPAYMAPEQLAGDPAADHRVDLYAVGLLAYELLTGEMPFAGASPQETLAAQLTRTPAPLDKVRRDVPPALSAAVMRCLAKRPEDRYQSAAELLSALDAIQVPSGEFAAAAGRRGTIGVLAAAGVLLAAIAVWQKSSAPPAKTATPRDTVTISPAGPLLTRAESLAIAKAVEARISARRTADTTRGAQGASKATPGSLAVTSADLKKMADSIRDEIQRAVFDSLNRVQQSAQERQMGRGGPRPGDRSSSGGIPGGGTERVFIQGPRGGSPSRFNGVAPELDSLMRSIEQTGRAMSRSAQVLDPAAFDKRATSMGPARRLVVTEPRVNRSMADVAPYGATLADTVRRVLGASKRFVIVNPDSVKSALEKTRTIDDLSALLNADAFASISVMPVGSDSVIWQLTVRDLTATGAYGLRAWTSKPVGRRDAIPRLDSLLAQSVTHLSEMDRAPRRPPPPTAPGGPLSKEAFDARAANMGPARRLVVWSHPQDRQHPEVEAAGNAITDNLRNALRTNPRYVVVPSDETLNALAKSRQRDVVAQMLKSDLMVTIRGVAIRDSVLWTATAWDLTANPAYEQRAVSPLRSPASAPTAGADSLFKAVSKALDVIDHAPRRTPQ